MTQVGNEVDGTTPGSAASCSLTHRPGRSPIWTICAAHPAATEIESVKTRLIPYDVAMELLSVAKGDAAANIVELIYEGLEEVVVEDATAHLSDETMTLDDCADAIGNVDFFVAVNLDCPDYPWEVYALRQGEWTFAWFGGFREVPAE